MEWNDGISADEVLLPYNDVERLHRRLWRATDQFLCRRRRKRKTQELRNEKERLFSSHYLIALTTINHRLPSPTLHLKSYPKCPKCPKPTFYFGCTTTPKLSIRATNTLLHRQLPIKNNRIRLQKPKQRRIHPHLHHLRRRRQQRRLVPERLTRDRLPWHPSYRIPLTV